MQVRKTHEHDIACRELRAGEDGVVDAVARHYEGFGGLKEKGRRSGYFS